MRFPPLQKECAVVCSGRPRAQSITFHFVLQSSGPVPHTATTDVTLSIVSPDGEVRVAQPVMVMTSRRMLLVSIAHRAILVRLLKTAGTLVRVERRVRNGSDIPETWECKIVSVMHSRGEDP